MGDKFQDRKDIDKLISDVYNVDRGIVNFVSFESESTIIRPLNTLEAILKHYGIVDDEYNLAIYGKSETDNLLNNKVNTSDLIDIIYPIGSIYISVLDTNPSTLFSGTTWSKIEGRFLLGAGDLTDENDTVLDSYSLGDEDGEHEHTLTTTEMPSHNHKNFEWNIIVAHLGNTGYYNTSSVNSSHTGGWGVMRDDANQNRYSGSTGGGQAHNNMPPYLAVNIWERIE